MATGGRITGVGVYSELAGSPIAFLIWRTRKTRRAALLSSRADGALPPQRPGKTVFAVQPQRREQADTGNDNAWQRRRTRHTRDQTWSGFSVGITPLFLSRTVASMSATMSLKLMAS